MFRRTLSTQCKLITYSGGNDMRTHDVAKVIGISTATLLRWLREGRVPEPRKDRLGWREFTSGDIARFQAYFLKLHPNADIQDTNKNP
jgi:hypothetical protein